jgi:hypothetical protein
MGAKPPRHIVYVEYLKFIVTLCLTNRPPPVTPLRPTWRFFFSKRCLRRLFAFPNTCLRQFTIRGSISPPDPPLKSLLAQCYRSGNAYLAGQLRRRVQTARFTTVDHLVRDGSVPSSRHLHPPFSAIVRPFMNSPGPAGPRLSQPLRNAPIWPRLFPFYGFCARASKIERHCSTCEK